MFLLLLSDCGSFFYLYLIGFHFVKLDVLLDFVAFF